MGLGSSGNNEVVDGHALNLTLYTKLSISTHFLRSCGIIGRENFMQIPRVHGHLNLHRDSVEYPVTTRSQEVIKVGIDLQRTF
jgi:hypothetical protein